MEKRLHFHHAPSSAFQWVECPASVGLQEQYPDLDDEEAREGEAAHWLAATCLTTLQLDPLELVGHTAPNGEIITLEIAQHTALYIQFVEHICRANALFLALRIEQQIKIPDILPDAFGTPDACVFDLKNMILHIFDFKYGYGIYEAFENWQCIMYACGLLRELNDHPSGQFTNWADTITVKIHIVQPRPYHVEGPARTWTVKAKNLLPYFKRLYDAANEIIKKTKTGKHCRYCSARHVCPALAESAMICVDQIAGSTPQVTSNEALSTEITILRAAIERAQWRLSAREAEAMAKIKAGQYVPGFIIEPGKGRRAWAKPVQEIIALGDACGIDLRKPPDVVTPLQAIDKHLDEAIVNAMSEKKTTFKLVDDRNLAKRIFGNDTTK